MRPIILYFTANYPDRKTLSAFLSEIDPEIVKYVEIGIPTENPLYDGPAIKTTHSVARGQYENEDLALLADTINSRGMETDILAYREVFHEEPGEYASYLRDSGVSGAIVPDLLTDYFDSRVEFLHKLEGKISYIPFFNPPTPDSVIEEISSLTNSWIYYGLQPSTGITVPYDPVEVSSRIFSLVRNREINFGFGVRSVNDVSEIIGLGSSGVAIGSMLVPMLKQKDIERFRAFQSELRSVIQLAE